MNLDLQAQTTFNDEPGLRDFLFVHRFVHLQTATALTAKFTVPVSTFGIDSQVAEDAWINAMKAGAEKRKVAQPASLQDWLNVHADIHNQTYTLLAGQGCRRKGLASLDRSLYSIARAINLD